MLKLEISVTTLSQLAKDNVSDYTPILVLSRGPVTCDTPNNSKWYSTSSTRTLIFPRPFQESLACSDTWGKREHEILISHNVLQAVISH